MCLDPKFGNSRNSVFEKNIFRLARDGFLRKMSNSEIDIGLVQQLDSARADIQFLSKNHAETLKGLHSEIKSLQQSNRELQFQLTFAKTNDELELKINQLEMENTKYKSKMNEMVSVTYHSRAGYLEMHEDLFCIVLPRFMPSLIASLCICRTIQ